MSNRRQDGMNRIIREIEMEGISRLFMKKRIIPGNVRITERIRDPVNLKA
jgi:hypothetical protein